MGDVMIECKYKASEYVLSSHLFGFQELQCFIESAAGIGN